MQISSHRSQLYLIYKIENVFLQTYIILNACFTIKDLWKYGITEKKKKLNALKPQSLKNFQSGM